MGKIDATKVADKLYIGSFPPAQLKASGFDVVVLCAAEKQDVQPDAYTIRVPFDDGPLSHRDYLRAVNAAKYVTNFRKNGKRVLVTCHMGINRSSLVAALSMMQLEKLTAATVIQRIRGLRGPFVHIQPLSNSDFQKALKHFENVARGRV